MRSPKCSMKAIVFAVMVCLTVFLVVSCATDVAYSDKPLANLEPDHGLQQELPVSEEVIQDDISINIQRPSLKGDGEEDEETSDAPEDDDADMTDFEGSPWEDDDETDAPRPETTKPVTTKPETTRAPETNPPVTEPVDTDSSETLPPNIIGDPDAEYEFYDVPLPELKQIYVIETAKEFGIPPEWIFGVMYVESRYQETAMHSSGKYIGIMQIAKSNLNMLNKKFGITDLQDFQQNVTAGAYFISYFNKKYDGDLDKILMCYHCGEGGAKSRWKNGIMQDGYCRKVRGEIDRILSSTYEPEE